MDEKTEEQIVGIKHSLNQTLGESIHLADSQRELKKEMTSLRKDCDSRLKIFKKLSFRFLLVMLALVSVAAVYAPLRVYFLEKSYVGKWLGCGTGDLVEKHAEATELQPGTNAELAEFMKERAIDRVIEGSEAQTEMSYLEKVAPAEAKRLANPEKNQMRIVKGADQ
ncbi:MAG: hypothetical protein HN607_12000 [Verrucomicrobia bacterium]|jgi:hypothetical protein|nr:hypothetical protein [Pseudomonadota bacterium]MBT7911238.1 hypothetical protein [Verrucomicrobiota bacterium]MDB4668788.1 hypothetical protein [bacterium]MDC0319336.1 hypothetical protein [Verrucomicrobiota bacterium]